MSPTNPQKFLIHSLENARAKEINILTNEDYLKAFPPSDLMLGFKDNPERRADVVQVCVGTKRGTALKLSPEAAAENLVVALSEKDTSADEIFSIITVEELVLLQDPVRVWKLIWENGWLLTESAQHKRYMAGRFKSILELNLFGKNTWLAMVHKIGYRHFVSNRVPEDLRAMMLELVITKAEPSLQKNRSESTSVASAKGDPFTAQDLLKVMDPDFLSDHVALKVLASVLEELASTMGWVKPPKAESERPPASVPKPPPEDPEIKTETSPDADLDDLLAADTARSADASTSATSTPPPAGASMPGFEDDDDHEPTTVGQRPIAPSPSSGGKAPPPLPPKESKKNR